METDNLFKKLKDDFEKVLDSSNNRSYLIQREISALEKFIFDEPRGEGTLKIHVFRNPSVFDPLEIGGFYRPLVQKIFEQFLFNGTDSIDLLNGSYDEDTLAHTRELFRYHQYLNALLTEKAAKPQRKKPALSHKQKLLTLHYLGLDLSDLDNSKAAKILAAVLELSEDNTRQYLSYISAGKNNVRTQKNLQVVQKLFENHELPDISKKIEKDMEKVKS